MKQQVEFEDGYQLQAKREELWGDDDEVPKYVQARVVSQMEIICPREQLYNFSFMCFSLYLSSNIIHT